MKVFGMLTSAVLVLSACASFEEDVLRFEAMDCAQLYQETNRYQDQLSSAEFDSTLALIEEVFGDKDARSDAEIDGIIADMEIDQNKRYLVELARLKRAKGC